MDENDDKVICFGTKEANDELWLLSTARLKPGQTASQDSRNREVTWDDPLAQIFGIIMPPRRPERPARPHCLNGRAYTICQVTLIQWKVNLDAA